jgi:hypothetical protein
MDSSSQPLLHQPWQFLMVMLCEGVIVSLLQGRVAQKWYWEETLNQTQ